MAGPAPPSVTCNATAAVMSTVAAPTTTADVAAPVAVLVAAPVAGTLVAALVATLVAPTGCAAVAACVDSGVLITSVLVGDAEALVSEAGTLVGVAAGEPQATSNPTKANRKINP